MTNKGTLFDRYGLRRGIAGFFLMIGLIGVCHYAWGLEVSPADKKAYFDALAATETATQEEITTKLLAVVPSWDPVNHERLRGGEIVWDGVPGQSRILVGAFMSRAAYQGFYAPHLNDQEYHLTKSLWVTVVPGGPDRSSDWRRR